MLLNKRGICVLFLLICVILLPAIAIADVIKVSGTGGAQIAVMKKLAEAFQRRHPSIEIRIIESAMGSSEGIKGVSGRVLDIAMSARPLKGDEKAKGLSEIEYAKSPFVIAVSKDNKAIKGLTLRELADIYSGKTDAYPDGSRIRLVLRPPSDSDTVKLKEMSPEMSAAVDKALKRKGMVYSDTDQHAADLLEKISGAIGSTTLCLILSENRNLRPLPINGVRPSADNIKNRTYPYYKTFYLIFYPDRPAVQKFINFLKSNEGHGILMQTGCGETIADTTK